MDKRIRDAFDTVRAEDELREKTRAYLRRRTGNFGAGKRAFFPGRLVPALACFLVIFAAAGSGWAYFTPTCAISIDVNPSVELEINRFDKVIAVEGYRQEGEELASQLDVRFLDWEEALEQVVASPAVDSCLAQNQLLSITVIGREEQRDQILEKTQASLGEQDNVYCCAGNPEQTAAAHEAGMSFGKYQAFLELQALDPQVTQEQAASMTMGEIRRRIMELSSDGEGTQGSGGAMGAGQGNGFGQGCGAGQGSGQGNGAGYGWGPGGRWNE